MTGVKSPGCLGMTLGCKWLDNLLGTLPVTSLNGGTTFFVSRYTTHHLLPLVATELYSH